jgi:hypothetical protein
MKKECQACPLLSYEKVAEINKKLDGILKIVEYLASNENKESEVKP